MESKAIDPGDFREAQHKNWDSAAVGWKEWSDFNDRADAHISERLVQLAGVQPGSRVLDVAAGYGEPALTAARKAGPEGCVVATDISAEMLAFGRERAAAAGLGNVEFMESDASSLDFPLASFDAAVSRWGIIFEPDAEAAAGRIRGFLKPGARMAISSWGEPDQVPFLSIPMRTTMARLDVPPPPAGTPGPLSRPNPAAIGGLLEGGGFTNVAVEQDEVTFEFDSPEHFTAYVRAIAAPIRAMIEQHAGEAQEQAWDAITQAAADAGRLEAAELLECGAVRLGYRLAPRDTLASVHDDGEHSVEVSSTGPPCCAPDAERGTPAEPALPIAPGTDAGPPDDMVRIPGGSFLIGSDDQWAYPADGEGPVREVLLDSFWIDPVAVSNAAFASFIEATGYATEAERFGWSFVFAGLLPDDFPPTQGVVEAPWWRKVEGADWQHPEGPQSSIDDRLDHPALHVSWNDADSYCTWAGRRLPTEAEWEFAARGGLDGKAFPWGDEREPGGEHRMNVWQGAFPAQNSKADGYYGTCPVDAFPPNGYGLHNVTGNVWEWAADWFDPVYRRQDQDHDPRGPATGALKIQKGGSYLCHDSYCRRYRVAARQGNSPDSSTGNTGFRCARDA